MVFIYNLNTPFNRFNNSFKHPLLKTNSWISFSYLYTGVINPTSTKIKQNRIYRKICVIRRTEHFFSDVLWIIDKQFITRSRIRNSISNDSTFVINQKGDLNENAKENNYDKKNFAPLFRDATLSANE